MMNCIPNVAIRIGDSTVVFHFVIIGHDFNCIRRLVSFMNFEVYFKITSYGFLSLILDSHQL